MTLPKRNWYSLLVNDPENFGPVVDAYDYYVEQYEEGRKEADGLMRRGKSIEAAKMALPGITDYRYNQLQEADQIIGFLQNREKRLLGVNRRRYREHYNRELTDGMVEKYAETDPDLLDIAEIRNNFALVRNKLLALTKHHEVLHFQLLSIGKLRAAGIQGAVFESNA
jgi:hypothetical protein